jgi:predicted dienelactone hydrolase
MSALAPIAFAAALSAAVPAPAQPAVASAATAPASEPFVFSRFSMPDGDGPEIEAGVWFPKGATGEEPLALVVISHGNGGDFRSHVDTAQALAQAGFVVAALTHTGDNWRDQSRATDVANRPRQVSVLIDFMLHRWNGRTRIDPKRIGAFGFSAGGLTVLTAAGGKPDLGRVEDHCRARPEFYDCRLMAAHPSLAAASWPQDTQIKALVVAAPALGFTFTRAGLASVRQPVQLWQAGADQVLPAPWYVEPVREALPKAPEFHRVERAGHFDFLTPCTAQLAKAAPAVCAPTPGFDRAAFHEDFNRQIARFFAETL